MDCRGAGCRDCDATVEGCDLHGTLGFEVVLGIAGALDVVDDEVEGFESERIAEGICLLAGEALNCVAHCIDARGSCDGARKVLDHPDVEKHHIRHHGVVHDADFDLVLGHGDDCVDRCFGTGACRRRHGNAGKLLACASRILQKIVHRVGSASADAGKLCRIHDRAATDSDDELGARARDLVHDFLDLDIARLSRDVVEDVGFGASLLDSCKRRIDKAELAQARVGEDGNVLRSCLLDHRDELLCGILSSVDDLGELECIVLDH